MSINATNLYSQNATAMRNTTVQPSQLNGGKLSQIFDLQAMRVVKGRVNLNTLAPPQYYTVINEYDGSPLVLGPNDFIIGYGVANGSTNNVGPVQLGTYTSLPLTPASTTSTVGVGNSPVVQFFINPVPPSYNTQTGQWSPTNPSSITTAAITSTLVTGLPNSTGACINPGYGGLFITLTTSCGSLSWIQMNQTINRFTTVLPAINPGAINISLVILSVIV
jgi:hypothetical protein